MFVYFVPGKSDPLHEEKLVPAIMTGKSARFDEACSLTIFPQDKNPQTRQHIFEKEDLKAELGKIDDSLRKLSSDGALKGKHKEEYDRLEAEYKELKGAGYFEKL